MIDEPCRVEQSINNKIRMGQEWQCFLKEETLLMQPLLISNHKTKVSTLAKCTRPRGPEGEEPKVP